MILSIMVQENRWCPTIPLCSTVNIESRAFVVFDILQFIALALISLTYLFALLSKRPQRMKTWFALMVSSLVYCISYLLLVGHQTGPEPPLGLCLFQAGLIYAAPPVVASAGLAFVVELYLRLTTMMVTFWIAMFTGLSNLGAIQRNSQQMFCHLLDDLPTTVTGILAAVLVVSMILLELYTIYYFWRQRGIFRDLRRRHQSGPIFPFALFVRVGIFTFAGGLGIILIDIMGKSTTAYISTGTMDLLAIIPILIAIVFGTQEDFVQMYNSWKRRGSTKDTYESE
ncbi:hypothetical protein F5878DRAFT_426098 [Lentinula raphanica]|uniref:Uncharacterized protein n=1 Tax=Lentinula raphanica TaxID=153919 RepID=A0AA38UHJ8_9AGAR|nr:hypothetical protein F5878DRAFT_426098 [Lentinula raphanica]